jgi:aryl-alcohol dehydrogenase-like predicted oxidoreductase
MAEALGMGVLPWSPLAGGHLTGKHVRGEEASAGGSRAAQFGGPAERDWAVIDAVKVVGDDLGASSAAVALAWVRGRSAVSSTLIGARTLEQLRANLASLDVTLAAGHVATLDEASKPTLDYPAEINAHSGPLLGFGGTTVDGVTWPVWPLLLASADRY